MNCLEARALLPRDVDGHLASDERALFAVHLDGCQECASERAAEAHTDALLSAACADHPFGDAAVESILLALTEARTGGAKSAVDQAEILRPRFAPLGAGVAAAAAALLGAILIFGPDSKAPTPVGTQAPPVLASAGPGLLRLGPTGDGVELSSGEVLRAGERLVAIATPAVIELSDGTRVDVHADTEVTLQQDVDGGVSLALLSDGRVFCEVAKRERPFRVRSRDLVVEVLGTQFGVDQEIHSSRVVVLEGRVEAVVAGDRRVLTANQGAVTTQGARLELLQLTARKWLDWVPSLARPTEPPPLGTPSQSPAPIRPPPTSPAPVPSPAKPGPTDPSLDTPVIPPDREGLPPGGH